MKKYFFDTETCGLTGPAVLLQYAIDDGPIVLYNLWKQPVGQTRELLSDMCGSAVCGFNLAFDWFQVNKLYNMFRYLPNDHSVPEEYIPHLAEMESASRDGVCLKPASCLDLMLYARKGPYQSLMERKNIVIRRVPLALAESLINELEKRIPFDPIYFARRKDKSQRLWKIDRTRSKDFCNVVLRFKASGGLKAIAIHAGLADKTLSFDEVAYEDYPDELAYAPFSDAVDNTVFRKGKPLSKLNTWPHKIARHIHHWFNDELAKKYASDDVVYTRGLYHHFGRPAFDDADSVLACCVGATRWKGFRIDATGLQSLRNTAAALSDETPKDPRKASHFIRQGNPFVAELATPASSMDQLVLGVSTNKAFLEDAKKEVEPHVAKRIELVLAARRAKKEVELYDKLLRAGRLHASFIVIGTKSGRMSGTDKCNPTAINKDPKVRCHFPMAFDNELFFGGDFDSFEITLAETVYQDPDLHELLLKGKKIHAIFATFLFPGKTYEDIIHSKAMYNAGKTAVFAVIYGGSEETITRKQNIPLVVTAKAVKDFMSTFKGAGRYREKINDLFCSMKQPNGIGSKVEWHDPADYIETIFGFRRYFTLENQVCKALFDLAENVPEQWNTLPLPRVSRSKDRQQTVGGATRSALFGAAFGIQSQNVRAAGNHVIQGSGAHITKVLQTNIWNLQPSGVSPWLVRPMNEHDSLLVACAPHMATPLANAVTSTIQHFRSTVPMLAMEWKQMANWSEK